MEKLTLDSTFENIRELIEGGDKYFVLTARKMAKHENNSIKYAFFFLMALALGGVYDEKSYQQKFIKFIKFVKYNIEDWYKMARKFVNPEKKDSLHDDYNALLKELKSVSLREIKDSERLKIKNNEDDDIFNIDGMNWFFKGTATDETGKDRAKRDLNTAIDCMIKLYERIEKIEKTQYLLLLSNKQLIMNGAPGTGKTYLAKNDIADLLLFNLGESEDVDKKNLRLGMVQFHPSYDYTDFIDGIRPDLSGKSLKYTLKNGSFKSFCRRAGVIERILAAGKDIDKDNIEKFLKGEDNDIIKYWKDEIENNIELKDEINKGTKEEFDVSKLPKFLFIIDEINRAEVSKVLGEVMYCLDPDYRGSDGAISTQYSSLATDETFFISKENDKFFIPSNVYIIGTMNDIDRSVEVFDFALRRRFAWYEIKVDEVMDSVLRYMNIDSELGDNNYKKYKEKIKILNEAIIKSLGLNEHYCIGPSYFAKIKLYLDDKGNYAAARKKVWDNHIIQILNEYVKGKRKETEICKIRKNFIPEFDSNDKKES